MNPDIDLRLAPLKKALTEVVLPALPDSERLARDQVMLVIGHLSMIEQQWQHALSFELESYEALGTLARDLIPFIDDAELVASIRAALEMATGIERTNYDAVQSASRALAALIDRAISGDHRSHPLDPRVRDAVIEYAGRQARRERIWFAGNGLDPDPQPELETLFAKNGA